MRGSVATLLALTLVGTLSAQERPFDFRLDVQSWMTRQGCSAAECHGGALGRGGFKLSLFGGDPVADWRAIALDRDARRIDLGQVDHSLLLRKPSLDLDHGGGLRLDDDSPAFAGLRAWIARGAPYADPRGTPQVGGLELQVDGERCSVTAHLVWTDPDTGTVSQIDEDVTARARFASTAPGVVSVDRDGALHRHTPGEAWLSARFAGVDARARRVEPFPTPARTPSLREGSTIDRAWHAGLLELGLAPAAAAAPDLLVRRLYLDLAGRLPTPAERRGFLDTPPDQRVARTVEVLLASTDFVDVASDWLAAWFEVPEELPDARRDMPARRTLVRATLRDIARNDASLLAQLDAQFAVGRPLLDRLPDPRDRAELFGRAVLGVRLGCARCHDHPLDRWRREDHLGFAALFVDPRPDPKGGMADGLLFDPETGDAAVPRTIDLLGKDPGTGPPRERLRAALRDDPRTFARNLSNRVVEALCGRGLVVPVDDHRPTNPGTQRELLDALTDEFLDSGLRLRALVAAVANSAMYACDSTPDADPARDVAAVATLARRDARPMPEALLHRAVGRALALDGAARTAPSASPLAHWLSLWNGDTLRGALDTPGSALDLIALDDDADRNLDALFELLLSRTPRLGEREALRTQLTDSADRKATLRALAHAMILSREFTSLR